VKTLTGESITLDVEASDTINYVKAKIRTRKDFYRASDASFLVVKQLEN